VVTSYDTTMRAIWREVPEDFLKQRHSWGADKKDEMWDGVLHLATRLSPAHQLFAGNLVLALVPIAKAKGLKAVLGVAIFRPEAGDQDYRIPDLVVFKPSQFSERGVEGACELAVEVLSPADETYDKLDFYARVGVRELWVLDPESCVPEIFTLRDRRYEKLAADPSGAVASAILGVSLRPVDGPKLAVVGATGELLVSSDLGLRNPANNQSQANK